MKNWQDERSGASSLVARAGADSHRGAGAGGCVDEDTLKRVPN